MDQPGLPTDLQLMGLLQAHMEQQRQLQQQAQPMQQEQEQQQEQEEYAEEEQEGNDDGIGVIPVKKPQSSQYTGVVWNANSRRFRAAIKHEGKKVFLGNYTDEAEAARAFDRAAIKLRGAETRTNFPIETYGDLETLVAEGVQGLPPARPVGRPRKHPPPEPGASTKKSKKRKAREVIELDGVEFDDVEEVERALEASMPPYKKVAGLYYIPPEAAINNPALDAVRRAIDAALSVPPPQSLLNASTPTAALPSGPSRSASTSLGAADTGLKRELSLPPGFQLPKRKIGRPSNADKAARAALEAAAAAAYASVNANATTDQQASSVPASLNALLLAASAADAVGSAEAALTAQRAATFLQSVGPGTGLPGLLMSGPSISAAAVATEGAAAEGAAAGAAAEGAVEGEPGNTSDDELSSYSEELQLPSEPGSAHQGKQKMRHRVMKHLPPGYSDVSDVPRYKGVSWQSDKGKWRVNLSLPEKQREHIGYFEDPEEAARAYDRAALQFHGAGTTTNFPLSDYLSPAQLATAAAAGHLPETVKLPPKKRGRPPKINIAQAATATAAAAGLAAAAPEAETAAATSALGALAAGVPAAPAAKSPVQPASAIAAQYAAAAAAAAAQRQAASLAATGAGQVGEAAAAQYEGVSWVAERSMYSASIEDPVDKQKRNELGLFESAEEAARTYDRAAVRLHGTAARTNFGLDQYTDILSEHLLANNVNFSQPQALYMAMPATSTTGSMVGAQLPDLLTREQAVRIKQTIQLTQAALLYQQHQQQEAAAPASAPTDAPTPPTAAAGAASAGTGGTNANGDGAMTPSGRRSRKTPPASTPNAGSSAALKLPLSPTPIMLQLSALQQMAASLAPPALDALAHAPVDPSTSASTTSAVPNPMASAIPLSASAAAALLPQAALAAGSAGLTSVPPSLFMVLPQGVLPQGVQLPQNYFP